MKSVRQQELGEKI